MVGVGGWGLVVGWGGVGGGGGGWGVNNSNHRYLNIAHFSYCICWLGITIVRTLKCISIGGIRDSLV